MPNDCFMKASATRVLLLSLILATATFMLPSRAHADGCFKGYANDLTQVPDWGQKLLGELKRACPWDFEGKASVMTGNGGASVIGVPGCLPPLPPCFDQGAQQWKQTCECAQQQGVWEQEYGRLSCAMEQVMSDFVATHPDGRCQGSSNIGVKSLVPGLTCPYQRTSFPVCDKSKGAGVIREAETESF